MARRVVAGLRNKNSRSDNRAWLKRMEIVLWFSGPWLVRRVHVRRTQAE